MQRSTRPDAGDDRHERQITWIAALWAALALIAAASVLGDRGMDVRATPASSATRTAPAAPMPAVVVPAELDVPAVVDQDPPAS